MPFHDLNVLYKQDHTDLAHVLSFHHELGYNTIALSVAVNGKLPPTLPTIPTSTVAGKTASSLKLLTRMTLTVSDTAQNHRISALQASYDILALRPTTEKTLQLCCSSLECDLISLDFTQRLPFILRFKTVASALQRGVRFEISYSGGISGGVDARRNLISGATSLIRATRGRGIIISSEAKNALGVRAPADAINLAQVWGLSQERGKEAVCEEAGRVVKLAGLKRTSYRGVVDIVDQGSDNVVPTNEARKDVAKPLSVGGTRTNQQQQTQPSVESRQSNGAKRKASAASLSGPPVVDQDTGKPLSKREMKRRAKKARLEGKEADIPTSGSTGLSTFAIQHESLETPTQDNTQIAQKK